MLNWERETRREGLYLLSRWRFYTPHLLSRNKYCSSSMNSFFRTEKPNNLLSFPFLGGGPNPQTQPSVVRTLTEHALYLCWHSLYVFNSLSMSRRALGSGLLTPSSEV
ncbi:unnamed protein product, partial [Ectocarpus sp. 13 AM-2016]